MPITFHFALCTQQRFCLRMPIVSRVREVIRHSPPLARCSLQWFVKCLAKEKSEIKRSLSLLATTNHPGSALANRRPCSNCVSESASPPLSSSLPFLSPHVPPRREAAPLKPARCLEERALPQRGSRLSPSPVAVILWGSWGHDPLTFWQWGGPNMHDPSTFYCRAAIYGL